MADEFNTGTNWWDSSSRTRFGTTAGTSWSNSMDSVSVSGSSVVFQDNQKLNQPHDHHQSGHEHNHHLHMMGLGLSSQAMEWNQNLMDNRGGDKNETSFRSMLQENLNTNAYHQEPPENIGTSSSSQVQWREKLFGESPANEFKQINRGFSLEQSQFSPHESSSDSTVTCQALSSSNFQMDMNSANNLYGNLSTTLQGYMGSDQNQYSQNSTYTDHHQLLPSWSSSSRSSVPQFLRNSPPKPQHTTHNPQLQFSNNAQFWNASACANDVRPSFFSPLQPQIPTSNFDEVRPKPNISENRESMSIVKKNEPSKRPRNETTSPLPAFKVRKEKMGDRITSLQQLVSPFGKTDTASVLSEAIEYIKFLHEQVIVLSTPYMKSGASLQHQQTSDTTNDPDGPKQDLRSRGLCLVPVSSTFPVTHETTVDFWTPTFGGTFR